MLIFIKIQITLLHIFLLILTTEIWFLLYSIIAHREPLTYFQLYTIKLKKEKYMKKNLLFIIVCSIIVIFESCQKSKSITLAVDFSSRDMWKYEFTCDIGGNFSFEDSVSSLSSTVNCILAGHSSKERDQLNIKAERIDITSNVMDEIEMMNIEEVISDAEYSIALVEGHPALYDSTAISFSGFGAWDLQRYLAKVIPALPGTPVSPGFTWDRERQFPITTSQGKATCEIYQSFSFDSIRTASDEHQEACISWLFRYTVDDKQFDTASFIDQLPMKGNGEGTAVLDIDAKTLVCAEMTFKTPACSLSNLSVNWEEKASLFLVN